MALADYQTLVDSLVRDRDQVVTSVERDAAIIAALAQYSGDRPRLVVVDVASTGGQRIDLPAGFTDDSSLVIIEYPIGQIPANEVPLSEVSIYRAPDQRQLQLPIAVPEDDMLRIAYTGAQVLDDDTDTVPPRHRQALASLAAAIVCGQLASYYATEGESTIGADSVDYKDKSQRWRLRQRDLAAEYTRVVGASPNDRNQPASVEVALKRNDALGYPRMFHPVRNWPR